MRVLLIDDDPLLLRSIARALRVAGIDAVTALSWPEVTAALAGPSALDAVVAKLGLRGWGAGGEAVLQEVRARRPRCARLLVGSCAEDDPRVVVALATGLAHRFVAEPWSHQGLAAAIGEAAAISSHGDRRTRHDAA